MENLADQFYQLTPHDFLNAVEEAGFSPTGEYQQLNSYENRVFSLRLEEDTHEYQQIVIKFYRPYRWSANTILDEHEFLNDLAAEGLSAVPPLPLKDNNTLMQFNHLYMAVFPKVFGRNPQEFLPHDLREIGKKLAHLHNIGQQKEAPHRLSLTAKDYAEKNLPIIEEFCSPEVWSRYRNASETLCKFLNQHLEPNRFLRIHGDCHRGNLLNNGREFFFVDFDDFCNGPIAQDLWMLLSSQEPSEQVKERNIIIEGYEELRQFPIEQCKLFEPLRALRFIHYSAWIGRRWEDPNFPHLFPQYKSYNYWAEEIDRLEQIVWKL